MPSSLGPWSSVSPLFLSLLAGCSGTDPQVTIPSAEVSTRRDAICVDTSNINTQLYSGEFGGIRTQQWMRTARLPVVSINSTSGVFCTGTLIDKRHVLTADHCVRSPANVNNPCAPVSTPTSVTSDYRADGSYSPITIPVAQVLERQECSTGADFAILRLSADAPVDIPYVVLGHANTGDSVVAIGFGQGGFLKAGFGTVQDPQGFARVDVMGGYSGGPQFGDGMAQFGVTVTVDCSGAQTVAGYVPSKRLLTISPTIARLHAAWVNAATL